MVLDKDGKYECFVVEMGHTRWNQHRSCNDSIFTTSLQKLEQFNKSQ